MNKRYRLLPVLLAFAGLAASCAADYDRAEFIEELQSESGLDEAVATCVADGVESQIGEERLSSRGDLTDEETEILTNVLVDCAFG